MTVLYDFLRYLWTIKRFFWIYVVWKENHACHVIVNLKLYFALFCLLITGGYEIGNNGQVFQDWVDNPVLTLLVNLTDNWFMCIKYKGCLKGWTIKNTDQSIVMYKIIIRTVCFFEDPLFQCTKQQLAMSVSHIITITMCWRNFWWWVDFVPNCCNDQSHERLCCCYIESVSLL